MMRKALTLTAIGLACGALLVSTDAVTRGAIAENRAAAD